MATIKVLPLDDGVDMRSNWQVTKSGTRKETHTKKATAKSTARTTASKGDTIVIYRTDGTIQTKSTYEGSRETDEENTTTSGLWTAKDWADRVSNDGLGL